MSATQTSHFNVSQRKLSPNWVWLVCLFVLLMVLIKPAPIGGDAPLYAKDVRTSLSHGWSDSPQIWNFAHLAWRPLGRLLTEAFLNPLLPYFGNNVDMTINFLLMLPSLIAALVCGLVVQRAVWKITGNAWAALLTSFALLCLNPLLNYSRVGSPYCCCLALTTVGLYFAAFHDRGSWKTAALAGALGGAAAVFWAPFLLSFPAIALSRWILDLRGEKKFDFRFVAVLSISGALVVMACYGVAIGINHIHDVRAWMHESAPDSRNNTAFRMLNGIGRGVYEMGDDSVWLKWYVFHDPYAKVSRWELLRLSIVELGVFYVSMLGLALMLWITPLGKRLLALIAISALPHVVLAMSYESGSVERYMAFMPAVFIGFGYVLGSAAYSKPIRVLAALLCCIHIPANLATASVRNVDHLVHRDPDRLGAMTSLTPDSELFVINVRDDLFRLSFGDPLNPLHLHPLVPVRVLATSMGPEVPYWREIFSCYVFTAWNSQGEAWVTKRVLADQPVREWGWVEGDDSRMKWNDIHQFFMAFDHSHERGGRDGFFLIRNSPENVRILNNLRGGTEPNCAPKQTVAKAAP
jgi:hypothetical protein